MKRRWLALFALMAMSLVLAAQALAAPPGKGLQSFHVTCNGSPHVIATASAGSAFWIGAQQYVLTSFSGTFTPELGAPVSFTQTFGQKKGLAGAQITCTGTFAEPGAGTLDFVATGVAVPPTS
jgi:hypothetical protein